MSGALGPEAPRRAHGRGGRGRRARSPPKTCCWRRWPSAQAAGERQLLSPSRRRRRPRRWSCSGDGRTRPRRRDRQRPGALPRLLDAAGHRGGLHPRRAAELHPLPDRLQDRPRRQGVRRQGSGQVRGGEGRSPTGCGCTRTTSARRSRSSSSTSARTCVWRLGRRGQGDGRHRHRARRRSGTSWRWTSTSPRTSTCDIAALVAFSGDVIDPESGPDKFNEHTMNPGLKGRDIRDAFDTDEFNVLLVANKYQTGFDQPQAVRDVRGQAARRRGDGADPFPAQPHLPGQGRDLHSRLRERCRGGPPRLRAVLQDGRRSTGVSDPNIVHNIQTKLDATGHLPAGRGGRLRNDVLRPQWEAAATAGDHRAGGRALSRANGATPRRPKTRRPSTRWSCSSRTWAASFGPTTSSLRSSTTATPIWRSTTSSTSASSR